MIKKNAAKGVYPEQFRECTSCKSLRVLRSAPKNTLGEWALYRLGNLERQNADKKFLTADCKSCSGEKETFNFLLGEVCERNHMAGDLIITALADLLEMNILIFDSQNYPNIKIMFKGKHADRPKQLIRRAWNHTCSFFDNNNVDAKGVVLHRVPQHYEAAELVWIKKLTQKTKKPTKHGRSIIYRGAGTLKDWHNKLIDVIVSPPAESPKIPNKNNTKKKSPKKKNNKRKQISNDMIDLTGDVSPPPSKKSKASQRACAKCTYLNDHNSKECKMCANTF